MKKNNKKTLALTILTACMLILGACGKSEEEKAAEEIYNHLDAEGQAAIDQMREEEAAYEAAKRAEAEAYEAAKEMNYMDVLTEWELGKDMLPCTDHTLNRGNTADIDFGNSLFILYPDKEYVNDVRDCVYCVGTGRYVFMAYYYGREGKIILDTADTDTEEEIENYTITAHLVGTGLDLRIYDKALDKTILIYIGGTGVNEEFASKNYEFIVEQVKSWKQNETTDEETADEKSVQGETPYGVYDCESGAKAYVESWHNEFDVIDIFLNDDEFMTDFVWVEGKTYNLIMPNDTSPLATAAFDENGNMQITALSDEAKPYEGYYIE